MSELYLVHHGIKGQSWGERNGPPYPLNSEQHSQKEKRSGSSGWTNKAKKDFKLSDKQKKAIKITSGIVIAAVATYGGYKVITSPYGEKITSEILSKIGNTPVKNVGGGYLENSLSFSKLAKPETITEAVKKSNPNPFDPRKSIYDNRNKAMNCGNSVLANELRMRGYDVIARDNTIGLTISSMGEFFDNIDSKSIIQPNMPNMNAKTISDLLPNKLINKSNAVQKSLKTSIVDSIEDNYARGCLYVPTSQGSHWITWEKTGKTVKFYNPQNSNYKLGTDFFGYFSYMKDKDISATAIRLDNLNFIDDNIKQVVTNAVNGDTTQVFDTFLSKGANFVMRRTN